MKLTKHDKKRFFELANNREYSEVVLHFHKKSHAKKFHKHVECKLNISTKRKGKSVYLIRTQDSEFKLCFSKEENTEMLFTIKDYVFEEVYFKDLFEVCEGMSVVTPDGQAKDFQASLNTDVVLNEATEYTITHTASGKIVYNSSLPYSIDKAIIDKWASDKFKSFITDYSQTGIEMLEEAIRNQKHSDHRVPYHEELEGLAPHIHVWTVEDFHNSKRPSVRTGLVKMKEKAVLLIVKK